MYPRTGGAFKAREWPRWTRFCVSGRRGPRWTCHHTVGGSFCVSTAVDANRVVSYCRDELQGGEAWGILTSCRPGSLAGGARGPPGSGAVGRVRATPWRAPGQHGSRRGDPALARTTGSSGPSWMGTVARRAEGAARRRIPRCGRAPARVGEKKCSLGSSEGEQTSCVLIHVSLQVLIACELTLPSLPTKRFGGGGAAIDLYAHGPLLFCCPPRRVSPFPRANAVAVGGRTRGGWLWPPDGHAGRPFDIQTSPRPTTPPEANARPTADGAGPAWVPAAAVPPQLKIPDLARPIHRAEYCRMRGAEAEVAVWPASLPVPPHFVNGKTK